MNANLLKARIRELGMTQKDVSDQIGVSLSRFNAKINGTCGAELSLSEIQALKDVLNIMPNQMDSIFFS